MSNHDAGQTPAPPKATAPARPPRLARVTFEFSRSREYFDAAELRTMTGQPVERFADVVVKELLDNALDACETAAAPPSVCLRLHRKGRVVVIAVGDNAGGIPPETVARVFNFSTRTSDKAAYRAPTRGAQGNALKTIVGIPYALGYRGPVLIEALGKRHLVRCGIDPAGELHIDHGISDVPVRLGTWVAVALPAASCGHTDFHTWARAFALFNPHASVQIREVRPDGEHANSTRRTSGKTYRSTVSQADGWRKFLPTDLTSPWWYGTAAFTRLVFSHIAAADKGGVDLLLRDFVRQFKGLSPTAKAKVVCDQFPGVRRLGDFRNREGDVARLLDVMRQQVKVPSPDVLGIVGEDHFRAGLDRWYGVKRWWYRKASGVVDGIAFTVEAALAQTRRSGAIFHGVNFSPTFDDPLATTLLESEAFRAYGIRSFLSQGHASPDQPVTGRGATAVVFHLTAPVLEFLDKGKTRLNVPPAIAEAAGKVLWAVVKDLYQEEERRQKDAARQARADRRERQGKRTTCSLKAAVFQVMQEAVRQSAGSLGRVSAHTLYYHVRPLIQQHTSDELTSDYFEQNLLPSYQREVAVIPEVYYEPRGTLYEPHTGQAIPLGTREVEGYVFPDHLYDKILFVEKKGLWPVFEAARMAERYDMAIVAGEGYASEACRILLSKASKDRDYQLFVLHDSDPYGYNIARTLREETQRMPGYRVKVVDLGLKLEDGLALGMYAEEFTRRKALPQGLELNEIERDYFEGRPAGHNAQGKVVSWICRRIELNAFSGPGLIGHVEKGLVAAGVRPKVVPDENLLQSLVCEKVRAAWLAREVDRDPELQALTRQAEAARHRASERAEAAFANLVLPVPDDLGARVRARVEGTNLRWSDCLDELANSVLPPEQPLPAED